MTNTFFTKTVEVKRLSYTGNKGTFGTVSTFKGYLRPLDEQQASINGFQYGQAFALICPVDADINKSDTISINGQEYNVEGVATHEVGLYVDHKRVLITKPQKK